VSEPLAHRTDPQTLREQYADPTAVGRRIGELREDVRNAPDPVGELLARGELVDLLAADARLDDALGEAQAAADRADVAGNGAQQHMARLRLAQVYTVRGEFGPATLLYTELLAAAERFGPVIEAVTHHVAALDAYEQRHWADARDHFARALALREEYDLPDDEREASRLGLDAALRRLRDEPSRQDAP
jgi:tetratricopeptide (TPR) repeat protein